MKNKKKKIYDLYLNFGDKSKPRDKGVNKTIPLPEAKFINLDFNAKNEIIGIELIGASLIDDVDVFYKKTYSKIDKQKFLEDRKDFVHKICSDDMHFLYCDVLNNEIIFDNCPDGNGSREWIGLKINKDSINVFRGSQLTEDEANKRWEFKNYTNEDDLAKDIRKFVYDFAESFETKLIRK